MALLVMMGAEESSTFATSQAVTRFMGRLRIYGHTSDGTVEKGRLCATGFSAEKDSQGLMSCRDTGEHTLGKNDFSVLNARRSS